VPGYSRGGTAQAPFGRNEFLRSTRDVKRESYTVYAGAVATETVNGVATKVLQPGEVLAKITSGAGSGMVGPFDDNVGVTDGRQTAANIVGINDTFLPWQLMERDVEVAVVYEATVYQAWCFEREAGARIPLATAAVLNALQRNATNRRVDISFV
jgi:hypothetical protein